MSRAIDASSGALEVAGANVVRTGLAIELREWDLFTGLPEGPWDLAVSNPPYVLPEELESLEPEVRELGAADGAHRAWGRPRPLPVARVDVLGPAASSCSRSRRRRRARCGAAPTSSATADVTTTDDLAGRERVVEGTRP